MGQRSRKGGRGNQEDLDAISGTSPYDKVDDAIKKSIIDQARVAVSNLTESVTTKVLRGTVATALVGTTIASTGFWPLLLAAPFAVAALGTIKSDVADNQSKKKAIVDVTRGVLAELNGMKPEAQQEWVRQKKEEAFAKLPLEQRTNATRRNLGLEPRTNTNRGVAGLVYRPNPDVKPGDVVAPGVKAGARRKSSKIGTKFNRCVKSVRQTVRARKGSTKESAAIAICTKSVLQTRGRTLKSYRKKRLVTQKKFRGGCWGGCA